MKSNIIFENLRIEMARKNLSIQDVARILDMSRDTASRKLSGKTPIYLNEAFTLVTKLFPDSKVEILFSELDPEESG